VPDGSAPQVAAKCAELLNKRTCHARPFRDKRGAGPFRPAENLALSNYHSRKLIQYSRTRRNATVSLPVHRCQRQGRVLCFPPRSRQVFSVCRYRRNFLPALQGAARPGDKSLIEQVVLPNVKTAIECASKREGHGAGQAVTLARQFTSKARMAGVQRRLSPLSR
jgi:hypothetical protein